MTAVFPGNGHRTAIPCTAFRAFVTVVAALFQELGVYCHDIIAMRCIRAFVTVIPGTWTSTATATCWHSAFVTVVTTLFQEMDTHCHATRCISAFRRRGYSNSRELVCDEDCCIPGNRHQLPCHALHLDQTRLTMNSVFCKCVLGTLELVTRLPLD